MLSTSSTNRAVVNISIQYRPLLVLLLLGQLLSALPLAAQSSSRDLVTDYRYKLLARHPQDPTLFTQGLEFYRGHLYQSGGLYGQSSLSVRKLDSATPVNQLALPRRIFAEGITLLDDKLYQLSWKSRRGFIYQLDSHDPTVLEAAGEFRYRGEGWGLANNGRQLIMSNGSSELSFLNAKSLKAEHRLKVTLEGRALQNINELEWVDGLIYANIWHSDWLVMINPAGGRVVGRVNLGDLLTKAEREAGAGVLNGIAWLADEKRLFVTGKNWPALFEIELTALD